MNGTSAYNARMRFAEFRASGQNSDPPSDLSALLTAMWWEAKGDWNRAHEIAQSIQSPDGAWVHAHLHRREGDEGNAGYWYRQAQKPHPRCSIDAEWEEIVRALLGDPLTASS